MPVSQVCISIKRGDSWSRIIRFEDETGSPLDITLWTIFFTMKAKVDDSDDDAKIKKTITVFSNPTAGEAELELTPVDTNQDIGSYVFDIQIKTNNNEIFTILEGIISIQDDITKRTL